jgi:hypothetical protein
VSLADYRSRSAVMVAFFRGLHCPFCRRNIVQLGAAEPKLRSQGVETLAIVTTPAERARLYLGHRPTPVTLASDPDATTHQAFGVPQVELVPAGTPDVRWPRATLEEFAAVPVTVAGELPSAQPLFKAAAALQAKDGYELTPADERAFQQHNLRLTAYFLLDRDGIVRWNHIEGREGMADIAQAPSEATLLAAAAALRG